jgi:hypothetical protein
MSLLDTTGAFCPHGRFELDPIGEGPLSGLTFAVKDLIKALGLTMPQTLLVARDEVIE